MGSCAETTPVHPPAFTGDGTVLSWTADDVFRQTLLYRPYGADEDLLGTNALFLPRPDAPRADNGVLELAALPTGRWTTVGHVFGGIATYGPAPKHVFFRNGPSWASPKAFAVQLRPRPR